MGTEPTNAREERLAVELDVVLNRLAKWRSLFAGWQLGTRAKGDPESDAVRDLQETRLMLRAEVNALTGLLIQKGVFTAAEWTEQLIEEAGYLNEGLERRFPGIKASDAGLVMDARAADTMRGWKP